MNLFSKSNLSLMNKIILAFVAYMALMLLVFSVIVLLIDRGHLRNISEGYSSTVLKDRQFITEQWLEERLGDIEVLALTTEVRSMESDQAIPLLKAAVKNHDDVYGRYYIIDTQGNRSDTLGIRGMDEGSYDFRDGEAATNGYIIGQPMMDETFKQPTIELYVPVVDDNRVVGVLGATVLLADLNNLVSDRVVYQNGYGWIVTGQGLVASHPDRDYLTEDLSDDSYGEAYLRLLEQMDASPAGSLVINTSGEREYLVYGQLSAFHDWYVIVSLYQSDIYSTVGRLVVNMAILFFAILLLSAAVSWYLAKDITSPIQSLIHVTTQFTAGVKGIRATIDSNDEIGTLAHSFNNMADTIVAHTDNLEELIKERTSILADLNYQIISRNKELGTMNEELEKTNNKLHELASTDMLTGLYNRHEFQRELQKTIELVNDGREENFALLFIDLDNFKYYNDTFSHEIGDFLLQQVSGILTHCVRANDVVGRYGGDEFVLLLREGDYEVAKKIAERIHQAILDKDGFKEDLKKRLSGDVKIMGKNKLSSSIGIVKYMKSMNITDAEVLLAKADETMYKAKKQGKSRVVVG